MENDSIIWEKNSHGFEGYDREGNIIYEPYHWELEDLRYIVVFSETNPDNENQIAQFNIKLKKK